MMLAPFALGLAFVTVNGASLHADTTYLSIPNSADNEQLALHCIAPEKPTGKSVLFIHGKNFPTMLAFGFEFSPRDSWMDFAAQRGFLACGLDFLGFGSSSRPPAMREPADRSAPVTEAPEAAAEIGMAVNYLQRERGMNSIHLVAHSWGTIPAATFAAGHSAQLKSLTLFGPVVPVKTVSNTSTDQGAWFPLTAQDRLEQLRFKDALPPGKSLLDPAIERTWAAEFAATNPHVKGDKPDIMRIPQGPSVDINSVMRGNYPYTPADVRVPIFVVYGNYDVVVNDEGASTFLAKFTSSPLKWRLRVDDGTHVMHLERNRRSLYESVEAFIQTTEAASP
jgi:pimeloyl-ACP methyl ester carboxylesterase